MSGGNTQLSHGLISTLGHPLFVLRHVVSIVSQWSTAADVGQVCGGYDT